ncbi:MAG: CotH kinase family protein [Verrucomicrobiales bacterium]|nr:CotH kinase family protein [Verrucomicrobiales bacterium]
MFHRPPPPFHGLIIPLPWVISLALTIGLVPLCPAGPVISEFVAANENGLEDQDGTRSDWIEIYNPASAPIALDGWHLTDTARNLTLWRFPAVSLPAQGFLVVFASGKNRATAGAELHTNFQLDRDGEFLALVEPDGSTVASVYTRPYPRHRADVAYGLPMVQQSSELIPEGAQARLLVPVEDTLGRLWTLPDFADTAWSLVETGVGYVRPPADSPEPPEPPPDPVDVTRPDDFVVPTSPNSPGNEGVQNAIDGIADTKYLNFDRLNAGFTVTPSAGPTVVTGLRLTTANDAPERDPASYLLLGSLDGRSFTEIARGPVNLPTARFSPATVTIANTNAWAHYRLLFPTLRNAAAAVAVQIAEVEFLGSVGEPPPDLGALVRTSIENALRNRAAGVYLRLPFRVDDPGLSARLELAVRFDDGFVAYLNGTEVARANAPANPAAASIAGTNRLRRDAVRPLTLDLSSHAGLLRAGTNVLALHGLNSRIDSGEFFLDARLRQVGIALGAPGHLVTPTPGNINLPNAGGLVDDLVVDPPRGFRTNATPVTLRCATPGVSIRYTTNGAIPDPTHGLDYTAPILISGTTTLRALVTRDHWHSPPVATHTYLFPEDIPRQSRAWATNAGFPLAWGSVVADYGLDRRVVGPAGTDSFGGRYVAAFKDDLRALPTISLVLPVDTMFGPQGIYAVPEGRGDAWERPVSFEWIPVDGTAPFQIDAGIRIQGGAFRSFNLTLKKSFRLVFRGDYGPKRLEQPVFGPDAASWFDTLVLRANSNDAWPYAGGNALYIRDTFAMQTALAMGIAASHSRFAHLYINGQYWGLYNLVERPDAAFSEAYLGGDKEGWDSINQDSAPDGTYDAWNRLLAQSATDLSNTVNYQKIQGRNPDGTPNPAFENLIDVDNYIDYLILNFYVGNTDWPQRNWWAGRPRSGTRGFQFRPWDTETALGLTGLDADTTAASAAVAKPYAGLRRNADFRMRFADHVQRHFFESGALSVNPVSPRWDPAQPGNNRPAARFAEAAALVRSGIIGESARWGDQISTPLRTLDQHWQPAVDGLFTSYFPQRSARVLAQFQAAGLYPRTPPPSLSHPSGAVPRGFALVLSAAAGTVHYTLDGTDPRGIGGIVRGTAAEGGIVLREPVRVLARTLHNGEWSALREAAFTVTEPQTADLHLTAFPEGRNQVRLRFLGRAGLGYTVYHREALGAGDWSIFHIGVPRGPEGPVELLVDVTAGAAHFYRVSIP